ncbi:MAG: hypothetical protein WEB87_00265 [Bacteriovoracaceae bacterium]
MIIIDRRDEIYDFLQTIPNFDLPVTKLNVETYERARGLEGDLLVVHSDWPKKAGKLFQEKLRRQKMLCLFEKNASEDPGPLANIVFNFHSKSDPQKVCQRLFLFDEYLKEAMVMKSQLLSMNRELAQVMGTVETELLRVKKAYENNTPRRFQDLKGVKVLSKYAAGESVGGEFFDIFKSQGKLFFLMSETSSYLASSSILQLFTDFKMEGKVSKESEERLLEEIKKEAMQINSVKKKKPLKVNMLTGIMDLASFEVKGHVFGNFLALGSDSKENFGGNSLDFLKEEDLGKGRFERRLERGERLLLLSPGFVKSWEEVSPDFIIETLVNNKRIKLLDILDEIFFQLKKDAQTGFLPHDASAIMLEVQKNVMLQV